MPSALSALAAPLLVSLGLITGISAQTLPVVYVTGQPFFADEVTTRTPAPNVRNVLPMDTTRVYRDSAGRTRVDVPVPTSPAYNPFVSIYDPVANVNYTLDTKRKVAHRWFIPGPAPEQTLPAAGRSGATVISSFYCKFGPPCPVTTSESLGTKFINGIPADGRRITTTPPAGSTQYGERESVVESWYSQELRIILLQNESNSLGESTTLLENINRAEPDPLLFRIPSDFTIVDQPGYKAASP
jgi:hypothetical protein